MEEFNLSNYESAPYLELDDYKAPEGINSYFVEMNDGIKLRVCHWLKKDKKAKGTILLQQGHNEFIEKYYETIKEFLDRNYSVIAFDWRGQGLSERTTSFTERAFIKSFKDSLSLPNLNILVNRNSLSILKNLPSNFTNWFK